MNPFCELYLLINKEVFQALNKTKEDFLLENQVTLVDLDRLKMQPEHRAFKVAKTTA